MSKNQGIAIGVTLGAVPFTGGASLLFLTGAMNVATALDAADAEAARIKADDNARQIDFAASASQVRQEAQLANELDFLTWQKSGVEASFGTPVEIAIQNLHRRNQTALDIEARAAWEHKMANAARSNAKLAGRTQAAVGFIQGTLQTAMTAGSLFVGAGGAGGGVAGAAATASAPAVQGRMRQGGGSILGPSTMDARRLETFA